MHILSDNATEITIILILGLIFLGIVTYFLLRVLYKHKKRILFYHKYNKFLKKSENRLNYSLKNKKVLIRENSKLNNTDISKNIANFELVNLNCVDLLHARKKNKKKRAQDLEFDLKSLQDLPKLIDVRLFEDLRDKRLLQDLIRYFFSKKIPPIVDWMIVSCFGKANYYKLKNKVIYAYNGTLLIIDIDKDKLIKPVLYKYEDLDVKLDVVKDNKLMIICNFLIKYNDEVLVEKRIGHLKISKTKIEELNNIIMLLDSYQLYSNCASISDANKKHEHIRKMNESTLTKIEGMSGRKFLSWAQLAFKSLYKTEVEILSDDEFGMYLLIQPSDNVKLTVVSVKRHQDKIVSAYIKKLKELQEKNNAEEAWIITNNEFTRVSVSLANNLGVKLIDNRGLRHLVNKYNTNYYQSF